MIKYNKFSNVTGRASALKIKFGKEFITYAELSKCARTLVAVAVKLILLLLGFPRELKKNCFEQFLPSTGQATL